MWNFFPRAFADEEVWNTHLSELDALIQHADDIEAKIAFVLWPNLRIVKSTGSLTAKVAGYLNERGIPSLDLGQHYQDRDPNELIANSMDAHAGEAAHAEVAQFLFEMLAPWEASE